MNPSPKPPLQMIPSLVFLALLLAAGPLALAADIGPDAARSSEPPVILDAGTIQNLRLETVTVERRVFEQTVFALGRIRVAPGRQAFVSSRIAGRAARVDAHVDTRVEEGTDLVVVESRLQGDPPPTIRLPAPMSGLIAKVHVALGQPVSPESPLLEIVDLSEVHAVAAVPEHRVGSLKLGNQARLRASALPDREFAAELAHFGVEADERSGTLEAAFHVENQDYALRPGMRVEFSIIVGSKPDVLAVPREAIQGDLGNRSVFVQDALLTNAFVRVPVVLGAENDRYVEVLSGLKEGERVVSKGAYSLGFAGRGAASLKDALDAAHGHEHNEDGSEKRAEAEEDHDHEHNHDDDHDNDHPHDHDHDDDHGHDHDDAENAAGRGGWIRSGSWTLFFATTTGLLLLLLILSVRRSRSATESANPGSTEGDDHA